MENLSILSLFVFFLLSISLLFLLYSILNLIKIRTLFLEFSSLFSQKDDENCSNSQENSQENSKKTQKEQLFTKKSLRFYYAKRCFFLYNSLFSLMFFWLKDRNYHILPLKSHFFFMFLACFEYFTIITIIFSYENHEILPCFTFLLSFLIVIHLFGLIKVFSSYFLSEFKAKTPENVENKRDSSVFYENHDKNPIFFIDKNSDKTMRKFFELSLIFFMGFLAFLWIFAIFEVFFTICNIYDALFGFFICFIVDFFLIRIVFIVFFTVFSLVFHKDCEFIRKIIIKDQDFKEKMTIFVKNLEKIEEKLEKIYEEKSRIHDKSSERKELINGSYIDHDSFDNKAREANNLQTFGEKNEKNMMKIIKINENEENMRKIAENEENMRKIDENEEKMRKIAENEEKMRKIAENDEKIRKIAENEEKIKEIAENKEKIRKIAENEEKIRKKAEILSRISNNFLKETISEIINGTEGYLIGKEEIIEEKYESLMKKSEIQEIIIKEGSFYKGIYNENARKNDKNTKENKGISNENTREKDKYTKENIVDSEELKAFIKDFLRNSDFPNEIPKKFNEFIFIPNETAIKTLKKHKEIHVFSNKNKDFFQKKMISNENSDKLALILNKISPNFYEEIFGKLTYNKQLYQNLKDLLTLDMKNIVKFGKNYQIGNEEIDEIRLKPLGKTTDFEAILMGKGVFYKDFLMKITKKKNQMKNNEENEKNQMKNNEENEKSPLKITKFSSIKDKRKQKEFIREFIKFSEKIQKEFQRDSLQKKGDFQKEKIEFMNYEFLPFLKEKHKKNQRKFKEKNNDLMKKMREKIKENVDFNENLEDLTPTMRKNAKKSNFRQNKYRKPNENSKENTPKSGISNILSEKSSNLHKNDKNTDQKELFEKKDPRFNRFKNADKNKLFINTNTLNYEDFDSLNQMNLEEARKRALIGIFNIFIEFY